MAEAVVSAVLHQLLTIVDREVGQEVRLVVGVEQQVQKMKSTFRSIQAVLVDAEKRQYLKKDGEAVKVWLDKLKHISYDIDHVLDEWNTAILKSQIERDHSFLPSKVCSCIPSHYSCFGKLALPLRHDIAQRIEELNKKLEVISREKDDFSFAVGLNSSTVGLNSSTERPKTTSLIDESHVYGREHDKDALVDRLLLSDNNNEGGSGKGISLIAIVGMIAKAILETLKGTPSSFNELESLLQEIHQHILGKKFLLVLDDVWTEDEKKWEPLKLSLSCGSQGSKILVTTRKEKVASILGCTRPLISLGALSNEGSWSLFNKVAFFERSTGDCESLESIGRKFVEKCAGLPLAIKTLAGLLRFKGTKEQWQRILDSEMWKLEDEIFEELYAPLLLSYYDLPMSVKLCFRYCAIFPKDHPIERDELIKLWMAQGFLGETQEGNDLEMTGEECFNNLAIRCFFQEFEMNEINGSIIKCKMHDIVHDFAEFLTKPECLLVAGDGAEVQRRVESSHGNVRHLTLTPNVEQHLPIIDGIKGVENLRSFLFPAFIHTSDNLQILTESLPKLFLQLSNLRMLVFYTNVAGLEFLKEIGKLIHLRYLSLEGNLGLIELPEALCDLYNLQTLNIRSCLYLRKLPLKIEKLINLRHLQNAHTRNITFMPKGMGKLTSLQTLEEFVVKKGGGTNQNERPCSLEDLGKLIHLRGHLRIKRLGDYVGEEASAARTREALLSTKAGLHSLGLDFRGEIKEGRKRKEEEALLLQALHPPPHLQFLRIESCPASAFPNWITLLTSLKWVTLYRCYNWESLPPMGNLPSLESLTIGGMYKVRKVGEELLGVVVGRASPSSVNQNIAFPNLKKLEFGGMDAWEGWEYEYEKVGLRSTGGGGDDSSSNIPIIMPKLQCLSIWGCPVLKMLPDHLFQSRALRQLEIRESPFLYRRFNIETGDHWPSISHIPTLLIFE